MQTNAATVLSGSKMIVLGDDPVGQALQKQYGSTVLSEAFLDELFGTRLPDSGHLTTERAIRVQPPTLGLRSEEDAGYVEPKGSDKPVPDAQAKSAAAALAAAAKTSSFGNATGDDDGQNEPDLSEESLQAKNPEVAEALYLAKKRGRGNDAGRRALMARAYHMAVIVSLPDKHRGPNFYAAIKDASRRIALTREQRQRAWAAREKNPIGTRTPTPLLQVKLPTPQLRRTRLSYLLVAKNQTGPAAAKQAPRPISRTNSFIDWMKETHAKNAAARALAQETMMPKPQKPSSLNPSWGQLLTTKKPNP